MGNLKDFGPFSDLSRPPGARCKRICLQRAFWKQFCVLPCFWASRTGPAGLCSLQSPFNIILVEMCSASLLTTFSDCGKPVYRPSNESRYKNCFMQKRPTQRPQKCHEHERRTCTQIHASDDAHLNRAKTLQKAQRAANLNADTSSS